MNCNTLYPVRTTYGYRIERMSMVATGERAQAQLPMPNTRPGELQGSGRDKARETAQAARSRELPVNRWVNLADPAAWPPDRTWGSASFDTDRGQILIWGGGHCGYRAATSTHTIPAPHVAHATAAREYTERTWDHGYTRDQSWASRVSTFKGNP